MRFAFCNIHEPKGKSTSATEAAIEKSKDLFPWKRLGIAKVHETGQGCPAVGQSYKEAVTVARTAIPGGTLMAVQKLEKHEWRRQGHRHVTQTAPHFNASDWRRKENRRSLCRRTGRPAFPRTKQQHVDGTEDESRRHRRRDAHGSCF